ncbi:ATP-binding cassette domain-containing protein [Mucilaginibacter antarcticus]|uniref:ATP-binding cassette domain-containing protein n=1 Tax=Mucilaginibacter antarcticus TaxID=1855725 RepID=A0ABW5XUK0_9SPHI
MNPLTLKADSIELDFSGRKILTDVFISCTQGEIVGLLGRNGCGKSSLLKIIFGLLKPAYKYLSIDDTYITTGYKNSRMAYLPQQSYLPPQIKIHDLAKMLVDDFFWEDFISHPAYIKHGQKAIAQLSGGEQRMLETLMIIYNKADFILLDEPFTHISPVQIEELKPLIRLCAKRKGIIVTDHQYRNVLDISDRIILLTNGCTKPINSIDDLVTYNYLSNIN